MSLNETGPIIKDLGSSDLEKWIYTLYKIKNTDWSFFSSIMTNFIGSSDSNYRFPDIEFRNLYEKFDTKGFGCLTEENKTFLKKLLKIAKILHEEEETSELAQKTQEEITKIIKFTTMRDLDKLGSIIMNIEAGDLNEFQKLAQEKVDRKLVVEQTSDFILIKYEDVVDLYYIILPKSKNNLQVLSSKLYSRNFSDDFIPENKKIKITSSCIISKLDDKENLKIFKRGSIILTD